MKKIILLTALFLAITVEAQLQEEEFASTNMPVGWETKNLSSGCDWKFGYTDIMPGSGPTVEATFPTGAALFDDASCGSLSEDFVSLTGPEIDLRDLANAQIDISYNLQVFAEKGEFYVEVFDGSIWQEIFFQDVDSPRNTGTHQTISLDVSPYLNRLFKVRFSYNDEGLPSSWGLGIDSYSLISSSVASVAELANLGFNYYPNPVNNVLKLTAKEDISQINVYNLLGQEVIFQKPSKTDAQIDLTKLEIGTYIMKVQVDNKIGSYKLLKQ